MRTLLSALLPVLVSGASHAMPPEPDELHPSLCDGAGATCDLHSVYYIRAGGVVDMGDVVLQFLDGGGIAVEGVQATVMATKITAFPGSSFSGTNSDSRLGLMANEDIVSYGDFDFNHTGGGGSIWMAADDSLTIAGGAIEAKGNSASAEGGTIDLWAGGPLQIDADISAFGGNDRQGGSLILSSDSSISLRGEVDLRGGWGGRLIMSAPSGIFVGMSLAGISDPETVPIDLSSHSASGDGGLLWASSALGAGLHADIKLNGAAGTSGQGDGGRLVLLRTGSILLSGSIEAKGSGLDSRGGLVWIDVDGSAQLDAPTDLSASGNDSIAGGLDMVALEGVLVQGEITAEAKGRGGQISMVGVQGVEIEAPISVDGITSSTASGGSIQLIALDGPVSLSETVSLSGRAGGEHGGSLELQGCTAQTGWGADITATGTAGQIQITGIDAGSGEITLISRDSEPVYPFVSTTIEPTPTVLLDPTLNSCVCEGEDCIDPLDQDGDSYRSLAVRGEDCDDTDPDIHPGATELPDDDVDNDCDGTVDEVDEAEDTGDTGGPVDTGAPSADGDDTADPTDDPRPPGSDTAGKSAGCGCSTGHIPSGLVLLLGILPWARRRADATR